MNEAQSVGPVLWLLIVVFSLILYAVLDGFDLGIGMLLPFEGNDERKGEMVGIVATMWDGNESWLVLVGVALFGGFPLAYGAMLPALYVPLIVMLLALIFRGVAFEFGEQGDGYSRLWGRSFAVGSYVASFCQGAALGAILGGIPVADGRFSGGTFWFLSPFSALTGLLLMAFYGLLGSCWLAYKTEGELLSVARRTGRALVVAVAALGASLLVLAFFATPLAGGVTFSGGRLALVVAASVAALAGLWGALVSLKTRDDALPFLLGALSLAALVVGGVAATFPYVVPPTITLWEAAAPEDSVNFLLFGVGLCIPVIIAYNAYAYWVFRGKFGPPAPPGGGVPRPKNPVGDRTPTRGRP